MVRIIIALLIILFALSSYIVLPILASGDKVRSDKAQGTASTHCINYDECPYGNPVE